MDYVSLLKQLTRIADSMERIVNIAEEYFSKDSIVVKNLKEILSNEEELFLLLTKIYREEEEKKRSLGLKRKPSRTVSKKRNYEVEVYLEEKLDDEFTVISDKGMQLIKKRGEIVAVLKIFTDLGRYGRGSLWIQTIQDIVKDVHKEYGVSPDRIFFLVTSMINGLSNQHVRKVLGKNISNSDLVTPGYRRDLEQFLYHYVDSITVLPNPHEQIYWLSAEHHPNVLGIECVDHGERILENLKDYNWLKPSITELIDYIHDNC